MRFFPAFLLCLLVGVTSAKQESGSTLSVGQRWGFGLLAGFGLSAIGFIAAFILVIIGKRIESENFKDFVRVLFSLACGTLIGDAVIHIISQAYQSEVTNSYIVSLILICSLLGFMILEKILVRMGVSHNHWVDEEQHTHIHLEDYQKNEDANTENNGLNESMKEKKSENCMSQWTGKGTAGYLNLVGSFIHNFVDGLTTGLVFATGSIIVVEATVIAIFSHEIPRELGDVAILLENRFTGCQAILSNGFINLMSLVGVVVGLCAIGVSEEFEQYIMVFVAGNFLYIAADIWRSLFQGKMFMNILQFLAFIGGAGAMFGIKFLEDRSDS